MNKTFWNGVVFASVMLFLVFGLSKNGSQMIQQVKQEGASDPQHITGIVESVLEQKLQYHDQLIN